MTTNPILELTAASPPASSSPKGKSKQGSDGGGVFDHFLIREIDRARPQKQVARPAAKASEKPVSSDIDKGISTQEAALSSSASYQAEDARQIKRDTAQPATPTAAESNQMNGTTVTAIAAANPEKPIIQTAAVQEIKTDTSSAVFEITLEMLTGGGQAGQAPPAQAQGLGVAVEQPPPETNSSEPARLAEAQTETKPTSDQVDPQIISVEEFQNLLLLKQAGKDGAQKAGVQETDVQNSGAQKIDVQNTGAQKIDLQHIGAQNADVQHTGAQKIVVDQHAELGTATIEKNQPAIQSAALSGSKAEQVGETNTASQTHAQTYLRSLQQYGQIEEVTFSQAEGGKADLTNTAEPGKQSVADQIDAGDATAQNTGTSTKQVALSDMQAASKQTQKAGTTENSNLIQTGTQVEENDSAQERRVEPGTINESGQDFAINTTKKTNGPAQSGTVDGQTGQSSMENQSGQVKPAQTKVETTAELGHAAKSSAAAVLKSQAESKASGDADVSAADAAKAGDKTPPAAILNSHTSEAAQQTSNVRSAQRIVQQTFNHLDGMLQSGQKTLRVQLYPENLGHLELRLTSQGGTLQIVILADSSVTQQALQQNARDLQQALQESGVNLTGLTVGQRGDQEQTPGESHRTYQEFKTSAQITPEGEIEDVDTAAASRLTYLNPYTSMEFRV